MSLVTNLLSREMMTCFISRGIARSFWSTASSATEPPCSPLAKPPSSPASSSSSSSLPTAPTRPLSGYLRFHMEEVAAASENYKKMMPVVAARWKALSDDEKRPYNEPSAKERQEWKIKMEAFKQGLVDQGKMGEYETAGKEKRLTTAIRSAKLDVKKLVEVMGQPKKINGYNMFISTKMKGSTIEVGNANSRMKQLSTEWLQMSEADKQSYASGADQKNQDLAAWLKRVEGTEKKAELDKAVLKLNALRLKLVKLGKPEPEPKPKKKKAKKTAKVVAKPKAVGKPKEVKAKKRAASA